MSDLTSFGGMLQCWLGAPGQLVPAGYGGTLSHTAKRATSSKATLGGRDRVQWGPRPSREWSVEVHPWEGNYYHGLEALLHGGYGPPPWVFVSPQMATTNLVPPRASMFDASTWWGGGQVIGGLRGADGSHHPTSLNASNGNVYFGIDAYVVPGYPVTGSAYATAGTRFHMHIRDGAGNVLVNVSTTAAFDGERVSVTATAPAGAATVRLAVAAAAGPGTVAGPCVTLTDKALPYSFGQGVDAVMVDGLDSSLFIVDKNEGAMTSHGYTVQEIRS